MTKQIFVLLVYLLLFLVLPKPVSADVPISGTSAELNKKVEIKTDIRSKRLSNFLAKYNSPLSSYSEEIIRLADKYGLDYRLVVSISGVESTFCKSIPYNSYNCWGWNNGKYAFNDYPDALETVSHTLSTNYYNRGYDTPEEIGPIYAPPSPDWAWKVRYFMNLLEKDNSSAFLAKQFSI